ncbi:MAG: Glu/Leu/Phe/Val dehydrogenase dimerization domain-containing protein [Litorimonas sp.]
MFIFSHPDFDNHEGIYTFSDEKTGLKAIIAVHNTHRGPACGGTRFWQYGTDEEAVKDALRLSQGMSYKNAMAGLSLGGGKAVIIKPEGEFDRKALFESYGRAVEKVGGQYITAEDVGVSPDDMAIIKTQTNHVAGLDEGASASGDPSPVTAEGVYRGIKVAVKHKLGLDNVKDVRVAVQGLGHVGYSLCKHLHAAGAKLHVADINADVLRRAEVELGAVVVSTETIHAADVDIFAPCALGGAINAQSLPGIKASIIGGAANNQLATADMGQALKDRGVLYCPDYVLNGGGIINVASEVSGHYDRAWVGHKLGELEDTLAEIFRRADAADAATSDIADTMARERLSL